MRHKILRGVLTSFVSILLVLCETIPVSAAAIDVGTEAISRVSPTYSGRTLIYSDNPANDTGILTSFELYLKNSATLVTVGVFYGSANSYTARAYASLGNVASGSKQTFSGLSVAVTATDFIGYYGATGNLAVTYTGAATEKNKAGNQFNAGTQTYGSYTGVLPSLYATGATAASYSITNDPALEELGIVSPSSTYYAKGSAPANPVVDGDTTFTITNNGSAAEKISIKGANFTGGVGWTLVSGAPGSNEVRITAYATGDNPASGPVLTTSDQTLVASLAASATKKWDFKLETASGFGDGAAKSGVITLTASAP